VSSKPMVAIINTVVRRAFSGILLAMKPTTLLIDLDDTLYPASCGLWAAIRARITLYVAQRLSLPLDQASALQHNLFRQYGTTLRGLQAVYQIDENEYLAFVHDVSLDQYIGPDPYLRRVLQALPQRKVIFTNADANHVGRVLRARRLEGCFERVFDIHSFAPYCKPMPEAFQVCLRQLAAAPQDCILVDDSLPNLVTAKSLGLSTVWISSDGPAPVADAVIPDISHLEKIHFG